MKIWARLMCSHRIQAETVQTFDMPRPTDAAGWETVLADLCKPLDISRPLVMTKHVSEWERFGTARFYPADFMEPCSFDRFEVELYPEKKQ